MNTQIIAARSSPAVGASFFKSVIGEVPDSLPGQHQVAQKTHRLAERTLVNSSHNDILNTYKEPFKDLYDLLFTLYDKGLAKLALKTAFRQVDTVCGEWDYPTVKLIADSKGRLTCRELFPPGVPFEAEKDPATGKVVLVELVPKVPSAPTAVLLRQGGKTLLKGDRTVTRADVQKALEEFP